MPTSTPTRRPRPSAPLFKHSYITFIGHWKGQLCILVVVLIVGLIYFIIRDPIEKWRRGRKERSSAKARAGLLAAVKREKEREKEKERSRDRDRDRSPGMASIFIDGEKDGIDGRVVSAQAGQSSNAGAASASSLSSTPAGSSGSVENRKQRRRKSSVLKVETKAQSPSPSGTIASAGLLTATATSRSRSSSGSASMAKSPSATSLVSAASGGSGSVASRSSTPSLALPSVSEAVDDVDQGKQGRQQRLVEDDDVEEGEGKRSTAEEKGKGRADPLPRLEALSNGGDEQVKTAPDGKRGGISDIRRPSPIHIHVRQPTVVLNGDDVSTLANTDTRTQQRPRQHADSIGSTQGSSIVMSTADSASVYASSDRGGREEDAESEKALDAQEKVGAESNDLDGAKDTVKAKDKKRDEGFSIFPDEGWLPPSALATLAGGEKKKKKKGKGGGNGGGSGSSSVTDSHTAAMIAHASGLVKNGESSRMATSSSGSVSGRSITSASASTSGSPLSRSQVLPPLPSLASAASPSGSHKHLDGSGTGSPPSAASYQHRNHQRNGSLQFGHSRKASMGKISGTSSLEEQIRERDEIIDNLRAEVGRAKAEEMKARSELGMRGVSGVKGGAQDDEGGDARAETVQRQLTEALAGMSSQASRIEMLERLIAASGMQVPASNQPITEAGSGPEQQRNGNNPSSSGPRRQSHHQPRLNRITSMPNGSLHGGLNGHSGNLAVPMSPMHPQMAMQGQQPGNVPFPAQSPMMRQPGAMTPLNHPSPYMPSPNANMNIAMQSPHMQYSPHMQVQAQGFSGQFGHAMMHPLLHQQQMAQMQIQMMHGQQQQHYQQQQQQQPYTPQRNSFHHTNGISNGNGIASPSPYRRASTAASVGRASDRDRQREHSAASQSDKERERDDSLGVADHPLAGPLTPGHHHASPARYAASIDSSQGHGHGQGDNGVFGAMQAEALGYNGDVHPSDVGEDGGDEYEQSYGMFPSMQGGMEIGALGYADTGIGRPPGEERGVEGQRRASVESSVLKRKPIEPLSTMKGDADGEQQGGSEEEKKRMEGVVEEVVVDEEEEDALLPKDLIGPLAEEKDSTATSENPEQERSNTSSPPSSGPTSPRSRQVLVTPGSTTMEMQEQDDGDHTSPGKNAAMGSQIDLNGDGQEYEGDTSIAQSPSPLPRSSSSSGMMLARPPQNASPMLFPVANGVPQLHGYHPPSPGPMQMHPSAQYAHMGQASPMLPLSIPLPLSPAPMAYPFPHAQLPQSNGRMHSHGMKATASHHETHPGYAHMQVNGNGTGNDSAAIATSVPPSAATTPLKLPDYTPTFASLAHTPEQLMEIKRMNEEAVRRAVEGSQA